MAKQYFKHIGVSFHPDTIKEIKEVAEKLKVTSTSELLRQVWRNYYEGEYKKKYIGSRSIDDNKKKVKKQWLEDELDKFDAMSDADATLYIHSSGYITANDQTDKTFEICRSASGERVLHAKYLAGGSYDAFATWIEFRRDLERYLKAQPI